MLPTEANKEDKVAFREKILTAQERMMGLIADGHAQDALPECKLTHTFTPLQEEFGCCTYARQMFIPKGTLIIGKIHRHAHLNFIMQGRVKVSTEFGQKELVAPCSFVSEVGLKRAVLAEEDTIWVTVHLTKFTSEQDLDKMEDEIIAPNYEEMGLISSVTDLRRLTA